MADFQQAFALTSFSEGGYNNDQDDAGGETYRGIARRFHPEWNGWPTIDGYKNNVTDLEAVLAADKELQEKVCDFYKKKFWNPFLGDHITDQAIADELFDIGVNMGTGRAVTFLQEGLNVLNRNGVLYDDLKVDGAFGTNTLNALRAYLRREASGYLLKVMNVLQGMHYINYMKQAPVQEKFARGWLNRVRLSRDPS